jgi:hypothetical protein
MPVDMEIFGKVAVELFVSIVFISEYRISQRGHVDADLVHTSCLDGHLEAGEYLFS